MAEKGNDHKLDKMDINVPRFGSVKFEAHQDYGCRWFRSSINYTEHWVLFVLLMWAGSRFASVSLGMI